MSRRVLAWQCIHCGKLFKSANIAERHEKTCLHNSQAKNCLLCEHMTTDKKCGIHGKQCSRAISANCSHFKVAINIPSI